MRNHVTSIKVIGSSTPLGVDSTPSIRLGVVKCSYVLLPPTVAGVAAVPRARVGVGLKFGEIEEAGDYCWDLKITRDPLSSVKEAEPLAAK
jgi:hypothetical protein